MNAFSFRNNPEHGQYNQTNSLHLYTYVFLTHILAEAAALASRSGSPYHNIHIWKFLQLRDNHISTLYNRIPCIEDSHDNQFECPNPYSLCFAPTSIANAMVREHNMEFVGKLFGIVLRWLSFPTCALGVLFSSPEHRGCPGGAL